MVESTRSMTCLAFAAALWAMAASVLADPPREAHGSSDAFSAPGVTLAWGVLRGADEASTIVVVRIAIDAQAFPWLALVGIDPFTKAERLVQAAIASPATFDVRMPRAQFADFPRTELRLFASAAAAQRAEPVLVVYYHGVPDTTPEFNDAAKLDAHLASRIRAARPSGGRSP